MTIRVGRYILILIRLPVPTRSLIDYPKPRTVPFQGSLLLPLYFSYLLAVTTTALLPVIHVHLNKPLTLPSHGHNYLVFPLTLCVISRSAFSKASRRSERSVQSYTPAPLLSITTSLEPTVVHSQPHLTYTTGAVIAVSLQVVEGTVSIFRVRSSLTAPTGPHQTVATLVTGMNALGKSEPGDHRCISAVLTDSRG
jgi:hypothetical protein